MATPTPVFPGAVATDSQLMVANNLIQTTLTVGITAANTILFVTSAAGFVANCLVSIDKEIMQIASVVTSPNAQLIVASGGRGFDGTSAVPHTSGAKVSMYIDAWHHNALKEEVKAIEAFLGPNGQNFGSAQYFIVSKQYDFPQQTPGGSLVPGNNPITLSPVPRGVNGSDQNHYLYISGGTGAAEAVLITGGTAVAGAASGTVIINCANTHTGAWTIKSATAGIQEAVQAAASPPSSVGILIPNGNHQLYQKITVAGPGYYSFVGSGRGATTLVQNHPTSDVFSFVGEQYCSVESLTIQAAAGKTGGWAINVNHGLYLLFRDLIFDTMPSGIMVTNATTECKADDIQMFNLHTGDGTGIWLNGGNMWITNVIMANGHGAQPAYGIRITNNGGNFIDCVDVMEAQVGLMIDPGGTGLSTDFINQIRISNCFFDHCTIGVRIFPQSGTEAANISFVNVDASSAYQYGFAFNTFGTSTTTSVILNGCIAALNQFSGIAIGGNTRDVTIVNSTIRNNSQAAANSYHGIELVSANMKNMLFANNTFGSADVADLVGYFLSLNSGLSNSLIVDNSMVNTPGVGRITITAPGAGVRITGNSGYNPLGQAPITVTASPFTYTAGTSPETVYIFGGTVTNVKIGATQVAAASPAQVLLAPGASVTVTYTAAPTMVKDIQ